MALDSNNSRTTTRQRSTLSVEDLERKLAADATDAMLWWKKPPANSPAEQNQREWSANAVYAERMRTFWKERA